MISRKELLDREYASQPIGPTGNQLVSKEIKPIGPIGKEERKYSASREDVAAVDRALELTEDLRTKIHPKTGKSMDAWYAGYVYRLGVARYLGLASEARQTAKRRPNGSPQRLFTWLLKRAEGGAAS